MNDSRFKSPVAIILLSIITCGIYFYYWLYSTTVELQAIKKDVDGLSPGLELLLCILCSPYIIYWFYKYGKITYEIQLNYQIVPADDNSVLYLILTIFGFGVVAAAIMQSSMNKIWTNE